MELLTEQHYVNHVLRMPASQWPGPARRGIEHIDAGVYVKMQGPSELTPEVRTRYIADTRFWRIDAKAGYGPLNTLCSRTG